MQMPNLIRLWLLTQRILNRPSRGGRRHKIRLAFPGVVPNPDNFEESRANAMRRSLEYMGLTPGTKMKDVAVDKSVCRIVHEQEN